MTSEAGVAFPYQNPAWRDVAPVTDDARVLEASVREPERFAVIFDRYFGQVHAYVARRLGTDVADDLAAETFLIAFRRRERFDRRSGAVRAWLRDRDQPDPAAPARRGPGVAGRGEAAGAAARGSTRRPGDGTGDGAGRVP